MIVDVIGPDKLKFYFDLKFLALGIWRVHPNGKTDLVKTNISNVRQYDLIRIDRDMCQVHHISLSKTDTNSYHMEAIGLWKDM